jgi:hypothetical protein
MKRVKESMYFLYMYEYGASKRGIILKCEGEE